MATVRVGVASGPWQTLCESAEPGAVYVGSSATIFSKPEEKEGNLAITVVNDIVGPGLRVVVVRSGGQERHASEFQVLGAGTFRTINATFPGLSLKDAKAFRVQMRPYEWVEFSNVAPAGAPDQGAWESRNDDPRTGTIEAEEYVDVSAQVAGRIVSLGHDPRGESDPNYKGKTINYLSPVEVGTVLARIDDTQYKARVDMAKAKLAPPKPS